MVDFLGTIRRFLELNPDQVLILFDEDYVAERDLRSAFQRAGLLRRLATLQPGQPLPTLGDLIRSHHNIVVFAQKPTGGKYKWDPYAFNWIQDTPLGATKPSQFTCKLNRGRPTNPLLMMNDWADVFPPRPTPNLPLVGWSMGAQIAFALAVDQPGLVGRLVTVAGDCGGAHAVQPKPSVQAVFTPAMTPAEQVDLMFPVAAAAAKRTFTAEVLAGKTQIEPTTLRRQLDAEAAFRRKRAHV